MSSLNANKTFFKKRLYSKGKLNWYILILQKCMNVESYRKGTSIPFINAYSIWNGYFFCVLLKCTILDAQLTFINVKELCGNHISKTVLKLFLLSSGYTYWKSKSSKKIKSFFPTCAIFSWKYNWNKAYIHFYPKLKAWGTSHFLTIIDTALVI